MSTAVGAVSFGVSLSLIGLSNSFSTLSVTMALYGFTMGIMDVSMNSCGIMTEIVAGFSMSDYYYYLSLLISLKLLMY